jgi:hypothetical protein
MHLVWNCQFYIFEKHGIFVDVFTFKTVYLFPTFLVPNKLKIVVVQGTYNIHSFTSVCYICLNMNSWLAKIIFHLLIILHYCQKYHSWCKICLKILLQGGSNMTGTDLCVNKPHKSRSYLNHLVYASAVLMVYMHIITYFINLFIVQLH